jgi:archaellum component FlaG (FlaF/FlaG flagellin family)
MAKEVKVKFTTTGTGQVKSQLNVLKGSFTEMNQAAELARKSVEAFKKAYDLSKLGAQAQAAEFAFKRMTKAVGADANKLLVDMKKLSGGTISNMDLMVQASKAATLGLPIDRVAEMMEIARAAAAAMGEDTQFMFESIVTGTARQSKLILDNLGIIINQTEIYKKEQERLGRALTDTEKRQAFLNEVIKQGQGTIEAIGDTSELASENFARFEATIDNIKAAMGERLLPVVLELTDRWLEFFEIIGLIEEPIIATKDNIGDLNAELEALEGVVNTAMLANQGFTQALVDGNITNKEFVKFTKQNTETINENERRIKVLKETIENYNISLKQTPKILKNVGEAAKQTANELENFWKAGRITMRPAEREIRFTYIAIVEALSKASNLTEKLDKDFKSTDKATKDMLVDLAKFLPTLNVANSSIRQYKKDLESIVKQQELLNDRVDKLNKDLAMGIITNKEFDEEALKIGKEAAAIVGARADAILAIIQLRLEERDLLLEEHDILQNKIQADLDRIDDESKEHLNTLRSQVQLVAGPLASAFANNIGKANQLGDALKRALNQMIAMVAQAAILAAIMSAAGLGGGFGANFLSFLGFAKGGKVPTGPVYAQGGARGTDTVPAMLTPGEVVLPARIVRENQTEIGQLGRRRRKGFGETVINIYNPIIDSERRVKEMLQRAVKEAAYA